MNNKQFLGIALTAILFSSFYIVYSCKANPGSDPKNLAFVKNVTMNKALNETGLFLAGKGVPENSKLFPYTKKYYYQSYQKEIKNGWSKFQQPNLQKIQKWWIKHSPGQYNKTVLYPFSGPDIMNALVFFPDAKLYIMFGLEKPGIIPRAHNISEGSLTNGLIGLKTSLSSILHVNFFRTIGMGSQLGNKSFNGISGVICFFLSLNGYTLVGARKIAIDANSSIVPGIPLDNKTEWKYPPRSKRIPGIEISFRKGNGPVQKIRYYMLNVINYSLDRFSPNFVPYLKKEGPFSTIIKSASYLLHNDNTKFTKIRAAILSNTDYLVQDDSGAPLRYFSAAHWKLKFHGGYVRPIPKFSTVPRLVQKDLRKAMKNKSTGVLPFSYGYNSYQSNLMTAERIKKKSLPDK
ncbi:MAG: hypothetical protein GY754_30620 [bacterium]|nr:hypothetical protein [bacterium]